MIQKRAVRAIFPGMSYFDILNHINLSTLKERRDYLCKKYFINMQALSHKVHCLLPKKRLVDYNLRHGNMYPLTVTRTNRLKNSLIPWGLYHWQWLHIAYGSLCFLTVRNVWNVVYNVICGYMILIMFVQLCTLLPRCVAPLMLYCILWIQLCSC